MWFNACVSLLIFCVGDLSIAVGVQGSLAEVRLAVACCRVRGTERGSVCLGPFEGGFHYLHYVHHSFGLRSNKREGTQPHP